MSMRATQHLRQRNDAVDLTAHKRIRQTRERSRWCGRRRLRVYPRQRTVITNSAGHSDLWTSKATATEEDGGRLEIRRPNDANSGLFLGEGAIRRPCCRTFPGCENTPRGDFRLTFTGGSPFGEGAPPAPTAG